MTEQVIRRFDPWRGKLCTCPPKYTLNPYTGCSHMCLYCYATSYIGRRKSTPKKDLIRKILHDLKIIDKDLVINMSTSSDPYPPEEAEKHLTKKVLEILIKSNCKILITTKSNLFIRDIDLIRNGKVAIMVTITTLDRDLARKLEPGAPSPEDRLSAIERASMEGIPVGVRIDPVIPYLNDDPIELKELVRTVVAAGARHITTSTYKVKPDNFKRMIEAFPELEEKLKRLYYNEFEIINGYRYLRIDLRRRLLRPIIEEAARLNVTYATCREGIPEYRRAESCDGSHLVQARRALC